MLKKSVGDYYINKTKKTSFNQKTRISNGG